jgi:hypothetical protein
MVKKSFPFSYISSEPVRRVKNPDLVVPSSLLFSSQILRHFVMHQKLKKMSWAIDMVRTLAFSSAQEQIVLAI